MHSVSNSSANEDGLLLLHISDIHFEVPTCLTPEIDQDHRIRRSLIHDLRTMVGRLGAIDAVLLSGDIAFKADPQEYETAVRWLSEVTEAGGCPITSVYTVPGNHDIDRPKARKKSVQGARNLIMKQRDLPSCDKELRDVLFDDETGPNLIFPLSDYNVFAARFGCDINPNRPFWTTELQLNSDWKLMIHGMTTVLFSGPEDDQKSHLYLGGIQRVFTNEPGIVRLGMMHHPADWLRDNSDTEDDIIDGCSILLSGHGHKSRYYPDDNCVKFSASAVNPSRFEGDWEPGYNLIKLGVFRDRGIDYLRVESHIRVWQQSPSMFIAKRDYGDIDIFIKNVRLASSYTGSEQRLGECSNANTPETKLKLEPDDRLSGDASDCVSKLEVGDSQSMEISERSLVYNFWELTPSKRRSIMRQLALLDSSEEALPEAQRYRIGFLRAKQQLKIEDLEIAINQASKE